MQHLDRYFLFDDATLQAQAETLAGTFQGAPPFDHVVIDDFLPDWAAKTLLDRFPPPQDPLWFDWRTKDQTNQPRKLGIGSAGRLEGADPFVHNMIQAFNTYPFVHFLETLSGISGLLPDPNLQGGGLHQILPEGRLEVHSDFSYQPKLKLYRRLNALLYLNPDWNADWMGGLELWDGAMGTCVRKVEPIFNRLVVFNTHKANHGHPHPLACPPDVTRKSLAAYYYTADPEPGGEAHKPTLWRQDQTGL